MTKDVAVRRKSTVARGLTQVMLLCIFNNLCADCRCLHLRTPIRRTFSIHKLTGDYCADLQPFLRNIYFPT